MCRLSQVKNTSGKVSISEGFYSPTDGVDMIDSIENGFWTGGARGFLSRRHNRGRGKVVMFDGHSDSGTVDDFGPESKFWLLP